MDVTFVLEESGVTATVEVPCEADAAAAKEIACTAFAVSPASVEMRIGTQVLEGTCRLQDTVFDAGVQVVLARPRLADIKCPAEYTVSPRTEHLCLSPCGMLCVYSYDGLATCFGGFDTETFETAFDFEMPLLSGGPPAISRCKTRCYLACEGGIHEVALPGGEVLRKVGGPSSAVFASGGVVVSKGRDSISVYDEDLTLLRSLSHERCKNVVMSHCGGWMMSSSKKNLNAILWDVKTGEIVACVTSDGRHVALSRSACVFAVVRSKRVHLYSWSGAALGRIEKEQCSVSCIHFTPCGKYVVVAFMKGGPFCEEYTLHQYDVATMSCVREIQDSAHTFVISPCSRVIIFESAERGTLMTRHLYPIE